MSLRRLRSFLLLLVLCLPALPVQAELVVVVNARSGVSAVGVPLYQTSTRPGGRPSGPFWRRTTCLWPPGPMWACAIRPSAGRARSRSTTSGRR